MNILLVASEIYPLVKTGGLADVVGALPLALAHAHDTRVLIPVYPGILAQCEEVGPARSLGDPLGFGAAILRDVRHPPSGLRLFLLDCPPLYDRKGGPYLDTDGQDYRDNHRRFAWLALAGAMLGQHGGLAGWQPDIVHAHDWQAGLIAAYLRAWQLVHPPVVMTIHNLQFTGAFPIESYAELALPARFFTMYGLEYYGRYSMLKAGLQWADAITTVSPTYAGEITHAEFGCGLDGLLRTRRNQLHGILNGVDYEVWNPASDPLIEAAFDRNDLSGKQRNKRALQARCGLQTDPGRPLFAIVSRLNAQKGLDLAVAALPAVLNEGAQLIVLGSGDAEIEGRFRLLAEEFPGQLHLSFGYDEPLSHRIQAGSDFLLVPSRFEPCGLTQLYAMRYGTLPIVRRTGGLADSVCEPGSDAAGTAQTGFLFEEPTADALQSALSRAMLLWKRPEELDQVRRTAMEQDFGWERSAAAYEQLYWRLLTESPAQRANRRRQEVWKQ